MTDNKLDGQRLSEKVDELQAAFQQLKAELGTQASAAADRVEQAINEIRAQVQEFKDSRSK